MSENDFQRQAFDDLNLQLPLDSFTNKRVSIRYRRNDIKAVVKIHSRIFPRLVQVVLRDISSRGAGVVSPKRLPVNGKICLYLLFNDGKRFEIDGMIIYSKKAKTFGIRFDVYQEALAEHLLVTQTDLKFS
jgi:PilZ domain